VHQQKFLFPFLLFLLGVALLTTSPAAGATVSGRVVGSDGKGVAQAIVFVQALPPGVTPPPVSQSAIMDQVNKTFVPGLLPVVAGTEVHFPNHDQIQHHVYSFSRTKSFELPLYKGEEASPVVFDKAGVVKVGCNIHDWMSGIILVLPTPYYAVTDEGGQFTLQDLPPGAYTLACWHALSQVKVEETVQQVQADENSPEVKFTLSLATARPHPAIRGARGDR